jgi:hypothetical protein
LFLPTGDLSTFLEKLIMKFAQLVKVDEEEQAFSSLGNN